MALWCSNCFQNLPWTFRGNNNNSIIYKINFELLQGVVYPSLHCLISKWAPPTEKGKFTGALMGGTLGTVVTWPILGAVIEIFGWKWAFFIPGIICIAWCIIWYIAVSNTPEEHKSISDDEKIYIAKCIGDSVQKTTVSFGDDTL